MKIRFIPFFIFITIFFSCSFPVTIEKKESICVTVPQWPKNNIYPQLDFWNVNVKTKNTFRTFSIAAETEHFYIEVNKDELTTIEIQPVIKNSSCRNFFLSCSAVYPVDNLSGDIYPALWSNYYVCRCINYFFDQNDTDECSNALKYFNWKKLEETLDQKDMDAFEKFDGLKTKKCTTSFNVDFETLIERIKNPPSRFYVPYFDTSSILPAKIKNLNLQDCDVLLCPYMPLNDFYYKKGYLTVQTKPADYKTAFLLNEKLIHIQNKTLISE